MDFVIQTRTLVALTAVVAVAACSGDGKSPGASTTSPPASAAVQPLTGEAAADGLPNRPVLVAKVDNSSGARPQVGLSAADLVVEELVEGGLTRLAVMSTPHCQARLLRSVRYAHQILRSRPRLVAYSLRPEAQGGS
jgi:hypothetical protein